MSMKRLLSTSLIVRLVNDTGVQIFFPFLAVIAAGTGFSLTQMGILLTIRSLLGLTSPVFGNIADNIGFRKLMALGLMLSAIASISFTFVKGSFAAAIIVIIISGLGLALFTPLLQAYVSAQLPWDKRSRGIGILEYAWALSGIIGLAAAGWLIDAFDWRMPFWLIGGILVIGALVFLNMPEMPRDETIERPQRDNFFDLGANARSAWAVIICKFLMMFAALQIYIAHGAWLGAEYGLSATQLGQVALMLGIADIIGSGLVSWLGDRMGKRNSMIYGMALSAISLVLLPILGVQLIPALIILFIVRNIFEFSIVSNLSLASEQVPDQRGKMMTLVAAFSTGGTAIAGITGPWLYQNYGVGALVIPSAIAVSIAFCLYLFVINERA